MKASTCRAELRREARRRRGGTSYRRCFLSLALLLLTATVSLLVSAQDTSEPTTETQEPTTENAMGTDLADALGLASQPTATPAPTIRCAKADEKSIQCGAGGQSGLPAACCRGLMCDPGGKVKCRFDPDYVEPTDPPTVQETVEIVDTEEDGMGDELADALGLEGDSADGGNGDNSNSSDATTTTPPTDAVAETPPPTADPNPTLLASDTLPFDAIFSRKSRSWSSILKTYEIAASPNLYDPARSTATDSGSPLIERSAFKFTEEPSSMPSDHPTSEPSSTPSAAPSDTPSSTPTSQPSSSPSAHPSAYPTYSPTKNIWISEPEPNNYRDNYFNYDPYSKRGPGDWDRVDDPDEAEYWREYQEYIAPSLSSNKCEDSSDRQSPIDVRFEDAKGQCFEYHNIRHKPGEYSIQESVVKKEILPSKLRFSYPGEAKPDANWATENDSIRGPSADIPKGWGHQLPVTHVDIKIPSEHWMEGKQYVAEYQIYLIQNRESSQRGGPAISILLDLHPDNVHNKKFQLMLDAFQEVWDYDMARCEDRIRKQRRLGAMLDSKKEGGLRKKDHGEEEGEDFSTWLDEPEEEEVKFQTRLRNTERKTQRYRMFNPWDDEILRSIWFFGYEGSLTEPPCTEFIEWRVIDTPGLITVEQLHQMKKLLFWHVDKDCDRTSVHYDGSVARPIQPYKGRYVHRCMCRDFISDKEREDYRENRCLWTERGEFGFPREQYTYDWYQKTHKYTDPSQQPKTDWA